MSSYRDSWENEMTLADVMDETDICFPGEHSVSSDYEITGNTHCVRCGIDAEREAEEIDVAYWQALLADENTSPEETN